MSAVLYVGVYLNTRLSQDHIIWFQSNPKEGRYRVFHTPTSHLIISALAFIK